jgi:hypothetical protein
LQVVHSLKKEKKLGEIPNKIYNFLQGKGILLHSQDILITTEKWPVRAILRGAIVYAPGDILLHLAWGA